MRPIDNVALATLWLIFFGIQLFANFIMHGKEITKKHNFWEDSWLLIALTVFMDGRDFFDCLFK